MKIRLPIGVLYLKSDLSPLMFNHETSRKETPLPDGGTLTEVGIDVYGFKADMNKWVLVRHVGLPKPC